jgi:hypothetical protein
MTAFAEGKQRQFEVSKPEAAIALRVEQSRQSQVFQISQLAITLFRKNEDRISGGKAAGRYVQSPAREMS